MTPLTKEQKEAKRRRTRAYRRALKDAQIQKDQILEDRRENLRASLIVLRDVLVKEILDDLKKSSFLEAYSWEEFEAGIKPTLEKAASTAILKKLLRDQRKS